MKPYKSPFLFSLLIAALLVSCKKENSLMSPDTSANSSTSTVLRLKATNTINALNRIAADATTISAKEQNINLQWTSGSASATEIKFEAKKQDGTEVEFKSAIQQTIDLFALNSILGNIVIPAGTYKEVEFKIQLSPFANRPALELKGQLTSGNTAINITFSVNENLEIKGEKNNIVLDNSIVHNAVTTLNLIKATQNISAAALSNAVRTNGEIILSAESNKDLYEIILKNLRNLEDDEDFH